jgi:hypothetical protein
VPASSPLEGASGAPRLNVALARLVDLKAALRALRLAGGRRCARAALTDRACARRNWHGARTTSSVDGWASMALRSHVVEAAGVRSTSFRQHSERRRACLFAWADGAQSW